MRKKKKFKSAKNRGADTYAVWQFLYYKEVEIVEYSKLFNSYASNVVVN